MPPKRSLLDRLAWILATWFGCGFMPKAPGTMGSLGAIPLYLGVARGGRPAVATAALVVTAVGVWASSIVARDVGRKDPQIVVVDEVAGILVTMLPMRDVSPRSVIVGFLLFRLFDQIKPWPARQFEGLPSGWGIVMDDIMAGVYAALLMAALQAARVLA